ncbi:MAG: Fe(2+)-trafficking protein, partial [Phycisphaerae bacterium]
MSDKVMCAKLGRELPKIDETTAAGSRAGRMCILVGGPEMKAKVLSSVSMDAWELWTDHMRMILNEYRLDPTADETNDA